MDRIDGRGSEELRDVKITRNYIKHAEGSVLIEMGDTKVICTASLEEKVPPFLKGSGRGWITGEYGMLPRSTEIRKIRESIRGRVDGRTMEIQRLIGRALRSVVNLDELGENTIYIDCDVIQADGGTRTASITGAFVALVDALYHMHERGKLKKIPIESYVAAVSIGVKDGEILLDLNYAEDSTCQVDMNIVMTEKGDLVEIQGTGEEKPFTKKDLEQMMEIGEKGIMALIDYQKESLGSLSQLIEEKENGNDCSHE